LTERYPPLTISRFPFFPATKATPRFLANPSWPNSFILEILFNTDPQAVLAPCVSEKTRSVIGMETKPASKRQLAYIRRLQTVVGETEPEITEEMSVSEASALISELVSKARQNGVVLQRQINEPRLGMAIKECFRQWSALGRSIHDERRKAFIDYTIDTYNLFSEIADKLGQDAQAQ
jgi:hypothetical protein